jgi:hypothetical protein
MTELTIEQQKIMDNINSAPAVITSVTRSSITGSANKKNIRSLLINAIGQIEEKIDEDENSLEFEAELSEHETALIHLDTNMLSDKDLSVINSLCLDGK